MKQFSFLVIFLGIVVRSYAQTGPSDLKTKGLSMPSDNGRYEEPTYIPMLQEEFPFGAYDVDEDDYNDDIMNLLGFEKQDEMIKESDYDESVWPFVDFANNEDFTPSKNGKMEMESGENESDELENDSASKSRFFEILLPQGMAYPQYDTIVENMSDQEKREQMLNEPTYDFGNPIPSSQDDSDQWPFLNIVEPQNKYVNMFLQNKIQKPEQQQLLDTDYSKGSNLQILTIVKESVIFVPADFKENRDRPILPISRETFDVEEGRRIGYRRFVLFMGPVLMGFGLLFFCLACITKRKEKSRRKTLKKTEIPYKPVVDEV